MTVLALFDRLLPAESASYLTNLLVGEELCGRTLLENGEVMVNAASALVAHYAVALQACGARSTDLLSGSDMGKTEVLAAKTSKRGKQ